MTNELRECVELLERLRDTYLPNHATERAIITAVVDRARQDKPEIPVKELSPKRKYTKK